MISTCEMIGLVYVMTTEIPWKASIALDMKCNVFSIIENTPKKTIKQINNFHYSSEIFKYFFYYCKMSQNMVTWLCVFKSVFVCGPV